MILSPETGGLLLLLLDLSGTFAFALSGATAGINRRADIFGVLVLSFAAANFGGIIRDVLIGALPPAGISDLRYMGVSLAAGFVAFFWHSVIERLRNAVLVFDALGLAFFAVSGAQKALDFHLSPVMAALLGMLTAIGGGIVRDLLLNEIPGVLRREIYAVAALAGATVVVTAHLFALPSALSAITGAMLCFGIRMLAIRYDWHLPTASSAIMPEDSGKP
ncbi:MAG: hypothetical protein H6R10_3015 [Rhodocyclaceae bacterium]|nr:hypothetical protein [Rhodocyclaceae bacterium]